MSTHIGKRLEEVVEVLYDNNKSAFARDLGKSPQSLTNYFSGKTRPGAGILKQLLEVGVNINWLLSGKGRMLLKEEVGQVNDEGMQYNVIPKPEPEVQKALDHLAITLSQVDFSAEKKLELIKELSKNIALEQNQYIFEQFKKNK